VELLLVAVLTVAQVMLPLLELLVQQEAQAVLEMELEEQVELLQLDLVPTLT
jgi:hypothetical protein